MKLAISTKGHYDFIDLTDRIFKLVGQTKIQNGLALIFVSGTTAALTTMEYEAGTIQDLKEVLEKLAPEKNNYHHHKKWGDANGAAHLKSALIGPSLTVPITNGRLELGQWQAIVLIDFDEKPREREIIIKTIKSE